MTNWWNAEPCREELAQMQGDTAEIAAPAGAEGELLETVSAQAKALSNTVHRRWNALSLP
ncbi:MAG: hypothetical protein ACLR5S_04220 [Ruminococcus sp.]